MAWQEGRRWRAKVRDSSGKQRTRRFDTEAQADQWVAQMEQDRAKSKFDLTRGNSAAFDADFVAAVNDKRTVAYLLEQVLLERWVSRSQKTRDSGVRAMKLLGFDRKISEITTDDFWKVIGHLRSCGNGNSTIAGYMARLSTCFKHAEARGWIRQRPVMPPSDAYPLPEKKDLVLKDEWKKALLYEMRDNVPFQQCTEFLMLMGCRVEEMIVMPWERIDFKMGTVNFVQTKTTNPRRLAISVQLHALLRRCYERKQETDTFRGIFPGIWRDEDQAYKKYYDYYKKKVMLVCRRMKLGPVVEKEWVIHTMRHTRITEIAFLEGVTTPMLMEWSGHTQMKVVQQYIHHSGKGTRSIVDIEDSQLFNERNQPGPVI